MQGVLNQFVFTRFLPVFCLFFLGLTDRGMAQGGESYVAVEAYSGKILLELDADRRRPVGDLSMVATAMVVLDWSKLSGVGMAELAIVPAEVGGLAGPNPMGMLPGDRIALREAMYSMLLGSDAVAAYTLANHVGASVQDRSGGNSAVGAFVREMNLLARSLGMNQTSFGSPHGMDGGRAQGESTARDMARLAIYAMRDAGFQFYVKQRERNVTSSRAGQSRAFKVGHLHPLVGRGEIDGVKAGQTRLSGPCAITSVEKKPIVQKLESGATRLTGRRLITVTLGSADRWGMTQTLINQGWPIYEGWRQQGSPVREARELLNVPMEAK